jgi:hypothetical protein
MRSQDYGLENEVLGTSSSRVELYEPSVPENLTRSECFPRSCGVERRCSILFNLTLDPNDIRFLQCYVFVPDVEIGRFLVVTGCVERT